MAQSTQNIGEVTLEQVLTLARKLRPVDQARLVVRLAPRIEQFLNQVEGEEASQPRRPLRGLLPNIGPAPSAEDIDEARREM